MDLIQITIKMDLYTCELYHSFHGFQIHKAPLPLHFKFFKFKSILRIIQLISSTYYHILLLYGYINKSSKSEKNNDYKKYNTKKMKQREINQNEIKRTKENINFTINMIQQYTYMLANISLPQSYSIIHQLKQTPYD